MIGSRGLSPRRVTSSRRSGSSGRSSRTRPVRSRNDASPSDSSFTWSKTCTCRYTSGTTTTEGGTTPRCGSSTAARTCTASGTPTCSSARAAMRTDGSPSSSRWTPMRPVPIRWEARSRTGRPRACDSPDEPTRIPRPARRSSAGTTWLIPTRSRTCRLRGCGFIGRGSGWQCCSTKRSREPLRSMPEGEHRVRHDDAGGVPGATRALLRAPVAVRDV